jgi:broad specificity phosphatase PhoE
LEGLSISPDCVSIYASPFSRTTQTAQAVADVLESSLGTKPSIQLMEELRERYFGPSLELQSHEHYAEIWAIDALDPMVGPEGGESVADVAHRVSQAILSIESELEGYMILVVHYCKKSFNGMWIYVAAFSWSLMCLFLLLLQVCGVDSKPW